MASMNQRNEWMDAVLKLLELTQKRKIDWSKYPTHLLPNYSTGGSSKMSAFSTQHLDRKLLIVDKKGSDVMSPFSQKSEGDITLHFINDRGGILFTFPDVSALPSLMKEVEIRAADVRGYLEKLMQEES